MLSRVPARRLAALAPRARALSALPQPHLLPPYAHALARAAPSPALAPPYAHDVSPAPGRALRARRTYVLVDQPGLGAAAAAASRALASPAVREADVAPVWEAALAELRADAARPPAVPEVGAQQLGAWLDSDAGRAQLAHAGVVVVRDVVIDAEADSWGRAVEAARVEREGQPTYYHSAQVEARADPSVLAVVARVSLALAGNAEPRLRVDAVAEIAHEVGHPLEPSATALHAHLATAPTPVALHPSRAAATYAQLRPFFQPVRSLLSFYSRADYLDPSNWVFTVSPAPAHTLAPSRLAELAHLPAPRAVLLGPGDMVLALPSLPMTGTRALPLHVLPAGAAAEAQLAAQRAAFERGLPPSHVRVDGELVAVEDAGSAAAIGSHAGRRAMGYE